MKRGGEHSQRGSEWPGNMRSKCIALRNGGELKKAERLVNDSASRRAAPAEIEGKWIDRLYSKRHILHLPGEPGGAFNSLSHTRL
ncbi:hypothetical protein E2C01_069042 [Portunus trituberculatus]|uniref:Uncharacterized protein n=1 Tax=Portunus trituberculatus TaxID=210409 RepID=A0A5B7HQE8_PORTR|nr:hypothetical protein [Portunus trituberculatus]